MDIIISKICIFIGLELGPKASVQGFTHCRVQMCYSSGKYLMGLSLNSNPTYFKENG